MSLWHDRQDLIANFFFLHCLLSKTCRVRHDMSKLSACSIFSFYKWNKLKMKTEATVIHGISLFCCSSYTLSSTSFSLRKITSHYMFPHIWHFHCRSAASLRSWMCIQPPDLLSCATVIAWAIPKNHDASFCNSLRFLFYLCFYLVIRIVTEERSLLCAGEWVGLSCPKQNCEIGVVRDITPSFSHWKCFPKSIFCQIAYPVIKTSSKFIIFHVIIFLLIILH